MSISLSYTNADGEPIMSGEAYRFEAQLDADYQAEPSDDWYDVDECPECGSDECDGDCDSEDSDALASFGGEDSWLDGSYEE